MRSKSDKKKPLVPSLRFPEFREAGAWEVKYGNSLFIQISNKEHNASLPVLAITQENGAIPRHLIDYHVSVTEKSLKSYKVVDIGDFIISLRTFQGGIEYSDYKGICSPAYIVLRAATEEVINDFFRHYFKTEKYIADLNRNLEGLRDGKMVSYKQFSEIKLPLPISPEQQKIAHCLSSLDEVIGLQAKKVQALKQHKKGLMQQLFPAEGETTPRLRFPEFREAGAWEVKRLGEVCDSFSGGTPTTTKKQYYGGSIPFIRSAEIADEITELFLTDEGVKASSAKIVSKGDVLVALYGANSGDVALSKISGAINQAILCLRLSVSNEFIYHYLTHKKGLIIATYIQGGQGNLSGEIVCSISIGFPDNEEQQKIAHCLSSLDEVIGLESHKLDALKNLKKGLMQQLFPQ
ncbi:restriction endonuclease subunit S, partial [Thiolapillus sp.]|uniref:restriction endonuclease subunit S n=3 Tax=Thiolapillus sp. TaxID=2017437 RepID=UPI0025FE0183